MQLQLIRHPTLVITIGDLKLLVDPMLSPAGAMDPIANAANQRRIPLVDLPFSDADTCLVASAAGARCTRRGLPASVCRRPPDRAAGRRSVGQPARE
jgi:hypothetical protein